MRKVSDYQGWPNYETWAVNLWLSNDQGMYNFIQELTEAAVTHGEESYELGDTLETLIAEEENPLIEGASLYNDLLGKALGNVKWEYIAKYYMDEYKANLDDEDAQL